MEELHAEVTFHFDDREKALALLVPKARELDLENMDEEDLPKEYTLTQAFQVVWHTDPEWLHKQHILKGWTLDKSDESGTMTQVWS